MKNTVSRLSSIQFGLQCPEEQAVLRCTVLVCLRFSCQTSETFLFIKIAGPMNFIILQWGILLKKIPTHANRPEWRRQWKALCRLWSWSMGPCQLRLTGNFKKLCSNLWGLFQLYKYTWKKSCSSSDCAILHYQHFYSALLTLSPNPFNANAKTQSGT